MQITIEIENLKCHGCANTIKRNISKIHGVQSVDINHETDSVIIEYDETVSKRDDFVHILSKLGYPEKGNNTVFKKIKSYGSCAVGRIKKES